MVFFPNISQIFQNLFYTYSPAIAALLLSSFTDGSTAVKELVIALVPRKAFVLLYLIIPLFLLNLASYCLL